MSGCYKNAVRVMQESSFFDKYHITKLTDITVEMVRCFLTDLQNKSELEKQYERVSDEVFNYSLWQASKVLRE